jgi:hypothetical protein
LSHPPSLIPNLQLAPSLILSTIATPSPHPQSIDQNLLLIYKSRVWGGQGEDIVASGKGKGGKGGEEGHGGMGEGSMDFVAIEDNPTSI